MEIVLKNKEEELLQENEILKRQLSEYKELVAAIKNGEIDALAITKNGEPDVFTLESIDYVYRVLVENFAEGALNISETGLIIYSNFAFENLIGTSTSSIVGTDINSIIDTQSKKQFKALFQKAYCGNSKGEIVLSHNGKKIPVSISLSSLYPRFPGIGIIITDLSTKKEQEKTIIGYKTRLSQKEEELLNLNRGDTHVQKKLELFNYITSHDLQEFLKKIKTYNGLILEEDEKVLSHKTKTYFAKINLLSQRVENLIKSLLNYSGIPDGNIDFEPVDLNQVIKQIKAELEITFTEKNVLLTSDKLPCINANLAQVNQLFYSLLENALTYTGTKKPEINLTCKSINVDEKEYWQIKISDNGIGFDMKESKNIFELFHRLHENESYKGTGIGLAICKKIVENHNGQINAKSIIGVGTIFEILFPKV